MPVFKKKSKTLRRQVFPQLLSQLSSSAISRRASLGPVVETIIGEIISSASRYLTASTVPASCALVHFPKLQ